MINIDITKLPKKLNEVCYFKKQENGVKIYNYSNKNKDAITIIELDCEIERDFAVSGSTLEMVRKLAPATVELKENKLVIKGKKGTFKGSLIEQQVLVPNTNLENTIKVNVKALKVLSEFVADNEKKPVLCGVNITSNGTMVATDSFKLARYLSSNSQNEDASITIPKAFVDLIKNEITEDEVELSYNSNSVIFKKDNITYVSTLIAGAYPNVERIFVNNFVENITFNVDALKENIDLAKNVGLIDGKEKYLPITFENGTLKANGTDYYESTLIENNDNDYRFTLASTPLELVLKNIESQEITIQYATDSKPLEIKDSGIEYILLPIKM